MRGIELRTQPALGWLPALRRYLAVLAIGNLVWELLHMPLYTLWSTGTWGEILFAALHCTGGDLLIGLSALTVALLVAARPAWPRERFRQVGVLTIAGGLVYTGLSEWLNVEVRMAWSYSELMPTARIAGFELGLSPVLQWLVVPTLAFVAVATGNHGLAWAAYSTAGTTDRPGN
jgi:hypothetical protein